MFKPLTDMTKTVMGLFQSVRGFTEQAGGEGFGQGLKGIVQGVFDLNIDGAMEQADAHFGAGIMRLTVAGEDKDVATAVRFRNYAVMRFDELKVMRDLVNRFISHDIEQIKGAVADMDDFLETREPESVCSDREEELKQEAEKMRKLVSRLSRLLESEEDLLGEGILEESPVAEARPETVPASFRPTIVEGQDANPLGDV
jgi:hypothetical protein